METNKKLNIVEKLEELNVNPIKCLAYAKQLESVVDVDGLKNGLKLALKAKLVSRNAFTELTSLQGCENHTAKMAGMTSFSTACTDNGFCKARHSCGLSVCKSCYSFRQLNRQANTRKKCERMHNIKTSLLVDYVPNLKDLGIFRFEAFGDIETVIQVLNYYIIAYFNPETICTLFTKNMFLVFATLYIFDLEYLDNLLFVGSSPILNTVSDFSYNPIIDFIFTVYTKEFVEEHNITITCGTNQCIKCQRCYTKHDTLVYINELKK